MPNNRNLNLAKKTKNDEFYTRYEDIAKELPYYKEQLANKIIYCNCDNPKYSNFYKFFKDNFHEYKLKSLIATYFNPDSYTYKTTFDGQSEIVEPLNSYGDFRSPTCIDILQQVDIVITNPPFSLFREFVGVLTKYDKKFIVIGSLNAIAYKEVFPLLKDNKIWLGSYLSNIAFRVPDYYEEKSNQCRIDKDGKKWRSMGNICWFTNLGNPQPSKELNLTKYYNENKYPKYENYNAINVDKVDDIPYDYNGIIGVPITFLTKYNPEQFEIIGLGISNLGLEIGVQPYKTEHREYRRNVQRKRAIDGDLYMLDVNGNPTVPYTRILIKKKN